MAAFCAAAALATAFIWVMVFMSFDWEMLGAGLGIELKGMFSNGKSLTFIVMFLGAYLMSSKVAASLFGVLGGLSRVIFTGEISLDLVMVILGEAVSSSLLVLDGGAKAEYAILALAAALSKR